MVSGVIIGGFGFGSFLFGFLSTALINPYNDSPIDGVYDQRVTRNVPSTMRLFAIIWASIGLISIKLLKPMEKREEVTIKLDDSEILKSKKFWLLYFMNFSSIFMGYLVVSNYKVFGSDYIDNDLFLTTVGSIASVMGSLRFLWSFVLDKSSYGKVYGVLITTQLMCCGLFTYSVNYPRLYGALVSIIIFCEGGHFVLLPAHCATVFETAEIGLRAFGYMFSCFGASCLSGVVIQNILIWTTSDPHKWLFFIAGCFNVVSVVLLLIYVAS